MQDRHPDIPWRAVRDVGNLYRHSYDNVAETYVWATVRDLSASPQKTRAGLIFVISFGAKRRRGAG
jgi:uncharacterized protein with HEPN domain